MSPHVSKLRFLRRTDVPVFVQIFDFLPDVSFFIKDAEGRFMALNGRGCEYCGVPYEHEALGRTDHDFFPKGRADEYRRDDQQVMRTGRAVINRIESAPEQEGSPRLVSTTKIPLLGQHGGVIGVAGFSRPLEQVREATANAVGLAKVVEQLHLHPEAPHPNEALARMAGLSVSQFDRCFKKTFGTSAHQYLLRARIEAVCRRLTHGRDTIAAIALECGFCDHAHLTRCFRQMMNTTPAAYRAAHQGSRLR